MPLLLVCSTSKLLVPRVGFGDHDTATTRDDFYPLHGVPKVFFFFNFLFLSLFVLTFFRSVIPSSFSFLDKLFDIRSTKAIKVHRYDNEAESTYEARKITVPFVREAASRLRNGSRRFCELTENGRDIETDRSRIRSVNEAVDPSLEIRGKRSIN